MAYKGTKIKKLAKKISEAVITAAKLDESAFDIHIFLQNEMDHQEWESGHAVSVPMYGVHCDRSYGGTKEAEKAIDERLPNELIIFVDDEGRWLTEEEACKKAWGEIAAKHGYYPIDFALGVSLAVEEII